MYRIVLLAAFLAVTTGSAQGDERTIQLEGVGTVSAEPDLGYVIVGVITRNPSNDVAIANTANSMAQLYKALDKHGVDRKDVQTIKYSVDEETDTSETNDSRHKITRHNRVGCIVTHLVKITIDDLSNMGKVLDDLSKVGATNIDSISFGNSKAKEFRTQARKNAVDDAKEKAETIARSLGQKLGKPTRVAESQRSSGYEGVARTMSLSSPMGAAPTEISGGSLTYTINVSIIWELLPGE